MALLFIIFTLYFLNFSILFQGQSLILLFVFYLICIWAKRAYVKLNYIAYQTEVFEWIDSMYLLILLKIWYMLLIRTLSIKLYSFYELLTIIKKETQHLIVAFFAKLHLLYKHQIRLRAHLSLQRLLFRRKKMKPASKQLYFRNIHF